MKFSIASLATALTIGLFSSTTALAAPNDHHRGAPPPRHQAAPPPPRHAAPPPPRHDAAPPPPHARRHMAPLPRSEYARHHHPPGRNWYMGKRLPRAVAYQSVADPYYYNLEPPPRGYRYVRVGNDILMMAIATGMIVNAIYDIGHY